MKRLKILLQVLLIAALAVNFTSCKDGDSEIVGSWYYSEDPEEVTIFNDDGTGATVFPGGQDAFVYVYDSENGILSMVWDDGIPESYYVLIDKDTMYMTDGSDRVEVYIRR